MGLFSFITAPVSAVVGGITGAISAGKAKAAAKIAAADAAKQRAHELRMANMAAAQQAGKAKQTQTILMVAAGLGVVGFIFLKKKR